MVVDAAELVKTPAVSDCRLADQEVPLITRAARARQAATDPQWWLKELAVTQEMNTVNQQFALYALHRLMPVGEILALSTTLSAALDRLPQQQWLPLATNRVFTPWRRRRRQPRQQISTSSLPASMSPRLACLLISRVRPSTARIIRDRYLNSYREHDPAVLEAIVGVVTEHAFTEPAAWAAALPEIAHAYSHNVVYSGIYHRLTRNHRPRLDMPSQDSRRICSEAGAYPLPLVSIAEALLATQTGADAIPVGKIAARDEWFTEA
jgi:hypothetical protein